MAADGMMMTVMIPVNEWLPGNGPGDSSVRRCGLHWLQPWRRWADWCSATTQVFVSEIQSQFTARTREWPVPCLTIWRSTVSYVVFTRGKGRPDCPADRSLVWTSHYRPVSKFGLRLKWTAVIIPIGLWVSSPGHDCISIICRYRFTCCQDRSWVAEISHYIS